VKKLESCVLWSFHTTTVLGVGAPIFSSLLSLGSTVYFKGRALQHTSTTENGGDDVTTIVARSCVSPDSWEGLTVLWICKHF